MMRISKGGPKPFAKPLPRYGPRIKPPRTVRCPNGHWTVARRDEKTSAATGRHQSATAGRKAQAGCQAEAYPSQVGAESTREPATAATWTPDATTRLRGARKTAWPAPPQTGRAARPLPSLTALTKE